jgi:hypothetical protein
MFQQTPLLYASEQNSAALVELLLSRGADVKAIDEFGQTALLMAACNRMHGLAIMPLLVKAGVDVNVVDEFGRTALDHGLNRGNASIMRALAVLYKPGKQLEGQLPGDEGPDPVGCVREGAVYGCVVEPSDFSASVRGHVLAFYCWALLRLSGTSISSVLRAMEECDDESLWRWVGLEILNCSETGDTLLHVVRAPTTPGPFVH